MFIHHPLGAKVCNCNFFWEKKSIKGGGGAMVLGKLPVPGRPTI